MYDHCPFCGLTAPNAGSTCCEQAEAIRCGREAFTKACDQAVELIKTKKVDRNAQ